ncbi:MAG: WXG100 family type VII secretion target [Mycobacterium sp.]
MSDAFRVDPAQLADVVARMAEFGRYSEILLTRIDSAVDSVHAAWNGEGAAAHAEAHRRWTHGESVMREALARLTSAGVTAHANYTAAIATNFAMWS